MTTNKTTKKKAPVKKTVAKKAPVKKAPVKKTVAKKAPVKKVEVKAPRDYADTLSKISEDIEQDERALSLPCVDVALPLTKGAKQTIKELLATAEEFKDYCAGLSANQIGVLAKICVVKIEDEFKVLVNAKVTSCMMGRRSVKENCLSRMGRPALTVKRWKAIQVEYFDVVTGEVTKEWFKSFKTAQIIQHEIDHGNGKLV